jgi:hypothetical protein
MHRLSEYLRPPACNPELLIPFSAVSCGRSPLSRSILRETNHFRSPSQIICGELGHQAALVRHQRRVAFFPTKRFSPAKSNHYQLLRKQKPPEYNFHISRNNRNQNRDQTQENMSKASFTGSSDNGCITGLKFTIGKLQGKYTALGSITPR